MDSRTKFELVSLIGIAALCVCGSILIIKALGWGAFAGIFLWTWGNNWQNTLDEKAKKYYNGVL